MKMTKNITAVFFLVCILGSNVPSTGAVSTNKSGQDTIDQGFQTIPEAKFRETFQEYFCRNLNKDKSDVVVSKLKITGNVPVPDGKIGLQPFQKGKRRLEGHVSLIVLVKVDGIVKNKVKLSGWVDIFESIVCASRDLKRGQKIHEDDLYLVRRNTSHLSSKILTDTHQVIGLTVKQSIKADTGLKEWMFEKTPIVDKGDIVTILAESGGLKVTVPGRVLMKGYSGELIKVQNLMSSKEVYAKVVNSSIVIVDF